MIPMLAITVGGWELAFGIAVAFGVALGLHAKTELRNPRDRAERFGARLGKVIWFAGQWGAMIAAAYGIACWFGLVNP